MIEHCRRVFFEQDSMTHELSNHVAVEILLMEDIVKDK